MDIREGFRIRYSLGLSFYAGKIHITVMCNISKSGPKFSLLLERFPVVSKMENNYWGARSVLCHKNKTKIKSCAMDEELFVG